MPQLGHGDGMPLGQGIAFGSRGDGRGIGGRGCALGSSALSEMRAITLPHRHILGLAIGDAVR